MRKLLRSIARHKMQVEGVQHINKPRRVIQDGKMTNIVSSYFAENWCKYVKQN